jgi:hypothetical protein
MRRVNAIKLRQKKGKISGKVINKIEELIKENCGMIESERFK